MASRRRGSRRSGGRSRRRSAGRSRRRSGGSSGGKAARRALIVANKRKNELKRAANRVKSVKRALRIAERSAGKRRAALRLALIRARRAK